MITITIDNINYNLDLKTTVTIYQYLYSKGIVLPCFCYHEKLSIAGNCRMCLVEANNALVVSCAMPVVDKMNIVTNSQRLLHARESVLEFLLANHPLDCPICDQGGECDLQDISKTFGLDRGRFYEYKRSVDNLNCFGPLIKTIMTRCIHCTRCVRFLSEYCDVEDLGVIDRGSSMKISNYVDNFIILNELSGNIIDLCPVGALTSMPYAFSARSWELNSIETVDITDSVASPITMDVVNNQIVRCSPVLMENLNEDWITNKARFCIDSFSAQRVDGPKIRIENNWINVSWAEAAVHINWKIDKGEFEDFSVKFGPYLDLETAFAAKSFFNFLGCNDIDYYKSMYGPNDFRNFYLLNDYKIVDFEEVDLVILIGLNLKLDAPLINSRLRKNYQNKSKKNALNVYSIGESLNYSTFPITNLGNTTESLKKLCEWRFPQMKKLVFNGFSNNLAFLNVFIPQFRRPVVLVGSSILHRQDAKAILEMVSDFSARLQKMVPNLNHPVFHIVYDSLGQISANEIGLINQKKTKKSNKNVLSYLLDVEPKLIKGLIQNKKSNKNSYIIYQGPYVTSDVLNNADVILPTKSYVEKESFYLNVEGRARLTKIVLTPSKSLLSDLEIFRLLYIVRKNNIGHSFFWAFDYYREDLKYWWGLINQEPALDGSLTHFYNSFTRSSGFNLKSLNNNCYLKLYSIEYINIFMRTFKKNKIIPGILCRSNNNYYNSDPISRRSRVMCLTANKVVISHFSSKV